MRIKGTTIYCFVSMKLSLIYIYSTFKLCPEQKSMSQSSPDLSESKTFRPACKHVCIYVCMHFSSKVRAWKFMRMQYAQPRKLSRQCTQCTDTLMTEPTADNEASVALPLEFQNLTTGFGMHKRASYYINKESFPLFKSHIFIYSHDLQNFILWAARVNCL